MGNKYINNALIFNCTFVLCANGFLVYKECTVHGCVYCVCVTARPYNDLQT